ncbi:MAG: HAD hydrolase-like protein [Candidatus Micrarchaeia archaeon]
MQEMHIFFDIDNTLFPTSHFLRMADQNAVNAMISKGLDCSFAKGIRELRQIIMEKGSNYPNHFDLLVERVNGKKEIKIVAAGVMAYHNTKNAMSPYPEVPRVLMALHDAGHHLHIASEGIEIKQWDKLLRLGIDIYFEDVYVTNAKDVQFYKRIIRQCNLDPSHCVMIGDRPSKDTEPAMCAGMYGIRIKRGKYSNEAGKCHKEIRTLTPLPKIISGLLNQ